MASPTHGAASPLALSMGDPAGIGLEIALMAWRDRVPLALPPFVLFGDAAAIRARASALKLDVPIKHIDHPAQAASAFPRALPVKEVSLGRTAIPGRPDPENAAAVISAIEEAVAAVTRGECSAVVTNPISKAVLKAKGFAHPGHTEFLAQLASLHTGAPVTPVMMLASRELRVVPLTVHIPLVDVPKAISRDLIHTTARIVHNALMNEFAIPQPRIAVAGLNPHAGEDGTMGREEQDLIAPALLELRAAGLNVTGPHPADTLFHKAARDTYDAVIAMYHDQALIPLKTLAFDTGVNLTLGLPFVRTSPDHGTAFDIAGTGRASHKSLIEALLLAARLSSRRDRVPAK